jgi:hypothetical protein
MFKIFILIFSDFKNNHLHNPEHDLTTLILFIQQ